jgi:methyl-accepting chemotaxis protein
VGRLIQQVLRPAGRAASIADRVSRGDLRPVRDEAGQEDQLSQGLSAMLRQLRELVHTIQGTAGEAASMAQQIAASTQQMSASTEEVAGTTGDLTERASQQAVIVRAAAEDASKILEIARVHRAVTPHRGGGTGVGRGRGAGPGVE